MDLAKVQAAIRRVIRRHAEAFQAIGGSQSKLLELASITGFAEHYKALDFDVEVRNPKGKPFFAVKTERRPLELQLLHRESARHIGRAAHERQGTQRS
jgi:hypothetical protein